MSEKVSRGRESSETSQWRLFSIGHAIEDKEKNSRLLKVSLSELNPVVDGELGAAGVELEASGKDVNGNEVIGQLRAENFIECEWKREDGNRITPPDVCKGEGVSVWRFGDDNKYYWSLSGTGQKQRKLETGIWQFGANPEGSTDSAEDNYTIEVSADRKLITLETTKKNGEAIAFTMQVNLDSGTLLITDNEGNVIEGDFVRKYFAFENSIGTKAMIEEKNAELSVEGGSYVKLNDRQLIMDGPDLVRVTAGSTGFEITPGSFRFMR